MQLTMLLLYLSVAGSCQVGKQMPPEVGTLTVFYAKEKIKEEYREYEKGDIYYDSNNRNNLGVELKSDNDNYVFEEPIDGIDGTNIRSVPKSKLEKKTYKMYQLPVQEIGSKAVFVSDKGCTARIFWSNANGHKYYSWDGKEVEWYASYRNDECYVLSVELISSGEKYLFEEQLEERQGYLRLYIKPLLNNELLIGNLDDYWLNAEGWERNMKSAYNSEGYLLVDQWAIDGIPNEISIAYLAEENALYIDGDLYYRKEPEGSLNKK